MAIDFELIAGPFGDSTSRYDVLFDRPYTVSEFVREVRCNRCEYGTIYIGTNCLSYKDRCEYMYGDLRSEIDEQYLDQRIMSATAHGGWGCMDYYLTLEKEYMTSKYIKKPIVVEAYQTDEHVIIRTLEGRMKADPGDYIITGIKGEKYPCKPDVFEATYAPYKEPPKKISTRYIMRRNAELNAARRKRLNMGQVEED